MLASKDAYFTALLHLDEKRQSGRAPTLAETAHLAQLLAEHDSCVKNFARAMRELGASDKTAQTALLSAITQINRELGDGGEPN
jgi:hypothetical protein